MERFVEVSLADKSSPSAFVPTNSFNSTNDDDEVDLLFAEIEAETLSPQFQHLFSEKFESIKNDEISQDVKHFKDLNLGEDEQVPKSLLNTINPPVSHHQEEQLFYQHQPQNPQNTPLEEIDMNDDDPFSNLGFQHTQQNIEDLSHDQDHQQHAHNSVHDKSDVQYFHHDVQNDHNNVQDVQNVNQDFQHNIQNAQDLQNPFSSYEQTTKRTSNEKPPTFDPSSLFTSFSTASTVDDFFDSLTQPQTQDFPYQPQDQYQHTAQTQNYYYPTEQFNQWPNTQPQHHEQYPSQEIVGYQHVSNEGSFQYDPIPLENHPQHPQHAQHVQEIQPQFEDRKILPQNSSYQTYQRGSFSNAPIFDERVLSPPPSQSNYYQTSEPAYPGPQSEDDTYENMNYETNYQTNYQNEYQNEYQNNFNTNFQNDSQNDYQNNFNNFQNTNSFVQTQPQPQQTESYETFDFGLEDQEESSTLRPGSVLFSRYDHQQDPNQNHNHNLHHNQTYAPQNQNYRQNHQNQNQNQNQHQTQTQPQHQKPFQQFHQNVHLGGQGEPAQNRFTQFGQPQGQGLVPLQQPWSPSLNEAQDYSFNLDEMNTKGPQNQNFEQSYTYDQANEAHQNRPLKYEAWTSDVHSERLQKPRPVFTFGFGGRFVVIFPPNRNQISITRSLDSLSAASGPSLCQVHSMKKIFANSDDLVALESFPGPLTGSSSKDSVIKFINNQKDDFRSETSHLLWEYLKIVVQYYGNSSLLGSEGEQAKPEYAINKLLVEQEKENSWVNETKKVFLPTKSESEMQLASEKVQSLLLSGHKKEACTAAIEGHIWSQALVLSMSLDQTFYRNVLAQYALNGFEEGSPMRTLFLMLSGHTKEIFKLTEDSPYKSKTSLTGYPLLDRWRENLAIVLAHKNQNNPASSSVIGELGDMLWARLGNVEAAHLCYLLADTSFHTHDNPNARLILIGGDHKKRRYRFVTPSSIQKTEIYEFSRILANPQVVLPPLQLYKLMYALRLVDLGLVDIAQKYCQVLNSIVKNSSSHQFNQQFVSQLHDFSERLSLYSRGNAFASQTGTWISGLFSKMFGGDSETPGGPHPGQVPGPAQGPGSRRPTSKPVPVGNARRMPVGTPPVIHKQGPSSLSGSTTFYDKSSDSATPSTPLPPPPTISKSKSSPSLTEDFVPPPPKKEEPKAGGAKSSSLWTKLFGHSRQVSLGSENMDYYYDPVLKKWVDKSRPEGAAAPETGLPPADA
eukprot:TRINITY_DN969_c0_g1_i1.p1 TRINITY_DN969_c0_g1~~TRINITY_DN969_c0_g1_i1.p1  ORF type:complete len:1232 (-),score=290.61 TRINITY_DN969_c0_g1_i1:32-3727(-)